MVPRRIRYTIYGLFIGILAAVTLSFTGSKPEGGGEPSSHRIHELFSSEDAYIEHISSNVSFDELNLRIVGIRRGDNFWKIARDHGVNIDTLIGANPHWDALTARVAQRIVVPTRVGVLHFITDFRELDDIAELYGQRPDSIYIEKLPPFYRLINRLYEFGKPVAVFVPGAKPTTLAMTPGMAQKFALREMFRSPLSGRYSSHFGGRIHPIFRQYGFHNGVDIAAQYGTPVGASCGGTVSGAGWMGGYGKAVIIDHPKGYRTLYGHLSSIYVRPGQHVGAGRIIGRVGSTGWSTGPHLHFTLWRNGRLINPLQVLW